MAKTLQQILGYQNLCGVITNPRGGIPADILPPGFTSVTRQVEGNYGTYTRIEGNRATARVVAYGSPSQRRELKDVADIPVVLAHSNEHIFHNVTLLNSLRNFDNPMLQQRGEAIIAMRTGQFRMGFNNLRLGMIYELLAKGKIFLDGKGNLLPTSAGAVITIDFGVPANNLNQTGIGAWNTAGTDIVGQINTWLTSCEQTTGYRPEYAFYGQKVITDMLANTQVQKLLEANIGFQNALMQQQIPDGFMELKWRPVRRAFFEDNAGTIQSIFGDHQVVFTPDPNVEWFEWLEGSFQTPRDVGAVSEDGTTAASAEFDTVYGQFSYALITADPPGIKHIAGDTQLPVIKVPKVLRSVPDVTAAAT